MTASTATAWESGQRPITIAILAMGGEGGGVLSDWIVALGEHSGWVAQSTSVAGVAQRTGATVYYVELYPPVDQAARTGARGEPVLSLFPTPGQVDVVIASELMEAGRAIQRGFTTPDRTTLIASTNRVYAVTEKIVLGDGRVDDASLLQSAELSAKRLISADFSALALKAGSVISSSLFGALAGAGVLPFPRDAFEDALRRSGKGVERSLAAFALGYDAALMTPEPTPVSAPTGLGPVRVTIGRRPPRDPEAEAAAAAEAEHQALAVSDPQRLVGPALRSHVGRVAEFPAASRGMLVHGFVRTAVYQNPAYAQRFLDRVDRVRAFDADRASAKLTTEVARNTALWMAYQDTIHVALQKLRARRLEGIRTEAKAGDGQLMMVREYLHPQLEEIADTMPALIGRALLRSPLAARVINRVTKKGMVVNTTSVLGASMMWVLAGMRPIRPKSLRYGREQIKIDEWIDLVVELAADDYDLAVEVAMSPRVLKGYGDTYAHGTGSFGILMEAIPSLRTREDAAAGFARLVQAALADESGEALATAMTGVVRRAA